MPLQASGQIKASEVNTELGRTSTLEHKFSLAQTGSYSAINTNNAATDRPDQATPHSISEWYNYNHNAASANVPNSKYWSWGGSTTMTWLSSYTGQPNSGNTNFPTGYTDAFTIAFWVSVQNSSTGNLTLIDIRNSTSTANRILVQYNYNQNKLVFLRRASSGNSRQEWNLHDHNSVCGLGTSSSNKWTSSNRGNVNTHNFTQLIFTYDGSGTGNTSTGMDCYWNGSELTTHLLTANFNTNSLPNMGSIGINGNFHNTGGLKDCDWDMIQIYNKKLSTTEISNLYNSGSPTAAANVNLNSDLVFEDRAEESTQVINGVTHNIDDTTDQFRYSGSNGETLVDY